MLVKGATGHWLKTVNSLKPSDAYMRKQTRPALLQIMACRLNGAKPLSEAMLILLVIGTLGTNFIEILIEIHILSY